MNVTRSVTVLAVSVLALTASPLAAQQAWQWNGRVDTGDAIEIKGINGGIRAVASNANEVRVSATRSARRSNPDEVRLEVVPHAGGTTICAVYPSRRSQPNECRPGDGGRMNVENNDVQVEWVVQVPRGVNFVGHTVNGRIEADGLPGDVDAHTVNGDVRVTTAGTARAATVNGNIEVVMGRVGGTGPLRFETTNGNISASFPGDLNAQLSASTVNGDIETDFPVEVRGRFGPRRVSGTIGSGGREIELATVNGSIAIRRR
jgi:hypothetical protein